MYLTNVETLARKFVDEKRDALMHLRDEESGFRTFWGSLDAKKRRQLATTSGETVLKVPRSPGTLQKYRAQATESCKSLTSVLLYL